MTLPREGVTAEEYDRMSDEVCRRIEIVGGSIIASPSATPRHNRITRRLANSLEAAAPPPWQVTTDVDLRLSDVPLHIGVLTCSCSRATPICFPSGRIRSFSPSRS